jgi:hypothetical protein
LRESVGRAELMQKFGRVHRCEIDAQARKGYVVFGRTTTCEADRAAAHERKLKFDGGLGENQDVG